MSPLRVIKRIWLVMAKRQKRPGRSARNGNAPSPYQKYRKVPYRYSEAYNSWKNAAKNNLPSAKKHDEEWKNRNRVREYKEAAE